MTLATEPLPDGVTATFAPATIDAGHRVLPHVRADRPVPLGSFEIIVIGTGGGRSPTAPALVTLVDFALVQVCFADVTGTVTDADTGGPSPGATVIGNGDQHDQRRRTAPTGSRTFRSATTTHR